MAADHERDCPFCAPDPERVFYRGDRVLGLWDAFPVSPGHALLVPIRHVAGWWDATLEERTELMKAVDVARAAIETRHRPDGYNLGVNSGAAAGQTVFHLHLHFIPRYEGDVPDSRGGVRHVIPGRGNYIAEEGADPTVSSSLVRGGDVDPLLAHLVDHLDDAVAVDIAAAFTLESGVRRLEEHLRDVLDRGGQVQILTGDYLGVTEPAALLRLLDLQARIESPDGSDGTNDRDSHGGIGLRVFESGGTSFHPKA